LTSIRCIEHPLALDKLGRLRDRTTDVPTFRRLVQELSVFLAMECTSDVKAGSRIVETPVVSTTVKHVTQSIVLVPILRAGLGMVEGMLQIIPNAKVGHIGLYRDPNTLIPVEYYANTPADLASQLVIVLDPMLATGGSAAAAISILKGRGAKHIKLASVIAAPEGIDRVLHEHPDLQVYAVAVDERLNDHGYIVPGLGDAGDRIFGTL
jgi:uracil phosphoribosyltransferase